MAKNQKFTLIKSQPAFAIDNGDGRLCGKSRRIMRDEPLRIVRNGKTHLLLAADDGMFLYEDREFLRRAA